MIRQNSSEIDVPIKSKTVPRNIQAAFILKL